MSVEIERKFLVKGSFEHLAVRQVRIRQSYLSIDTGKTIRIRITDNQASITVKSDILKDALVRSEWDYKIPLHDAFDMMKICLPGIIDKTRYYVPFGDHQFEVDVFHDKNEGLIIAEIELASENEKFEKPDWLGEEVTGNPAYYNANLIK